MGKAVPILILFEISAVGWPESCAVSLTRAIGFQPWRGQSAVLFLSAQVEAENLETQDLAAVVSAPTPGLVQPM